MTREGTNGFPENGHCWWICSGATYHLDWTIARSVDHGAGRNLRTDDGGPAVRPRGQRRRRNRDRRSPGVADLLSHGIVGTHILGREDQGLDRCERTFKDPDVFHGEKSDRKHGRRRRDAIYAGGGRSVCADSRTLGLFVDELPDGRMAIFIPAAPMATIGQVQILPRDRVQVLDATLGATLTSISQWGVGTKDLYKAT